MRSKTCDIKDNDAFTIIGKLRRVNKTCLAPKFLNGQPPVRLMYLAFITCLVLISCNQSSSTPTLATPRTSESGFVDPETSIPNTLIPTERNLAPAKIRRGIPEMLNRQVNSSAVSVSPDGSVVLAVNPDNDSITVVHAINLDVLAEIPVGDDPRTLTIDPQSRFAVVANHGANTVSLIDLNRYSEVAQYQAGYMPYGVVTDGQYVYVSEFGLGRVRVIDLANGKTISNIDVGPFPAGLALTADGTRLLVTHFFNGNVTEINLETSLVRAVASTGSDTNISQSIFVSPDDRKAYLPQTRSNVTNLALLFDTTVFPIINVLDLDEFSLIVRRRITLDTADEPVNMPFAVAITPDGQTLYGANAGSDDVSVIDLNTNRSKAHIEVGSNPRGIAITPDGSRVFVNNVLDGTLSVLETRTLRVIDTITLAELPLSKTLLEGKKIFNSSKEPLLSADNWVSCATCHFDGMMDTRTWLGFSDGPRNTPSLGGVADTLPIHWSGDLDELQDVEITIRSIQNGDGLVRGEAYDSLGVQHAGLSTELDALASYLSTIQIPPSPYQTNLSDLPDGQKIFNNLGCTDCHMPPLFTDRQSHDVGTGDISLEKNLHGRGTHFDTPSLRGLWMTAPYFHDGSAVNLNEVFETGTAHNVSSKLDKKEIQALIAYIKAIPDQ